MPKDTTQKKTRSKKGSRSKKELAEELARTQEQLAARTTELEDAQRKMKYLYADYDNLSRRLARERERYKCEAVETLMQNLLGFLDNFDQAVSAAVRYLKRLDADIEPEDLPPSPQPSTGGKRPVTQRGLATGMVKLYQSLMSILKAQGLEVIPTVGRKFDHNLHEAVLMQESSEVAENVIISEVQKGYRHNDRVLRPAKVIVSKEKTEPQRSKPSSQSRSASASEPGASPPSA